jgi:hypothetical protein
MLCKRSPKLSPTIKALAAMPLLSEVSKREVGAVQRLGTVVDLGPGRLLGRAGRYPRQLAIVVSGEIVATTTSGRRRTLTSGDWFGTIPDWSEGCAEPETFETVVATTVFVMSGREVTSLRFACPLLAARLSGLHDGARDVDRVLGVRVGALPSMA